MSIGFLTEGTRIDPRDTRGLRILICCRRPDQQPSLSDYRTHVERRTCRLQTMQLESYPAEKPAATLPVPILLCPSNFQSSLSADSPPRSTKRKRSVPPSGTSMTSSAPGCETKTRIGMACEACNRFKLKCSVSRPCQNCVRRGTECVEKPSKPRACLECKSRKIKCDQGQPCEKCVKHNRVCRTEQEIYRASSTTPSTAS